MIEQFPSNMLAGWFQFKSAELLEIEDEDVRSVPNVSF